MRAHRIISLFWKQVVIAIALVTGIMADRANGQCMPPLYTFTAVETVTDPSNSNVVVTTLSTCSTYLVTYAITTSTYPISDNGFVINLQGGMTYGGGLTFTGNATVSTTSAIGTQSPVFTITTTGTTFTISFLINTPSTCLNSPIIIQDNLSNCGGYPFLCPQPLTIVTPLLFAQGANVNSNQSVLDLNTGEIIDLEYAVQNNSSNANANIQELIITPNPDPNTTILNCAFTKTQNGIPTWTPVLNTPITNFSSLLASGDNELQPGDIFYVHFQVQVNSCVNATKGHYDFSMTCPCSLQRMNTDIEVNPGTPSITGTALIPSSTPAEVNSVYCPGGVYNPMGFACTNSGTAQAGYEMPNNNDKASQLQFYVYATSSFGAFDHTTLMLNGIPLSGYITYNPGFITNIVDPNFEIWFVDFTKLQYDLVGNPLAPYAMPFGPNSIQDMEGDGIVDDLPGNGTFTLTAQYEYGSTVPAALLNCAPGAYKDFNPFGLAVLCQNECGSFPGPGISGDIVHRSSFATNLPGAAYAYISTSGGSQASLPQDVVAGTPFNFTVCPEYTQEWRPGGSPVGYYFDGGNPSDYQVIVPMPPSYSLYTAGLLFDNNNVYTKYFFPGIQLTNPLTPNSSYPAPNVTIGQDGNNVIVDFGPIANENASNLYNITDYIGTDINYIQNSCFDIPLITNCAGGAGAYDSFNYDLDYFSGSNCSGPSDILTCQSAQTYHHCSGTCDGYLRTTSQLSPLEPLPLIFERNTLGWPNDNYPSSYYDCANSPPPSDTVDSYSSINCATPNIRRDRAYPGDEIQMYVSGYFNGNGKIGGPNLMGNDFNYIALEMVYNRFSYADCSATSSDIFDFEGSKGGITIWDKTTSGPKYLVPASVLTYTVTISVGQVQYDFQIPNSYLALYITSNTDEYEMDADLFLVAKVKDPFNPWILGGGLYSYGQHNIQNLRFQYVGLENGNDNSVANQPDHSCDSWGANFTMLQPSVSLGEGPSPAISTCDPYTVHFVFEVKDALFGSSQDDFPNEFRTYAALAPTVTTTFPSDYTCTGTQFEYLRQSYGSPGCTNNFSGVFQQPVTPLASIINGPNNNIVTINGLANNCWPFMDCSKFDIITGGEYYQIDYNLKASCTANNVNNNIALNTQYTVAPQGVAGYAVTLPIVSTPGQYTINHDGPQLLVTGPSGVNVLSNVATLPFKWDNSSVNASAENAWIAVQNQSVNSLNLTALGNVSLIVNSHTLTPSSYFINGGMQGALFYLSPITNLQPSSLNSCVLTANVESPDGCVNAQTPETILATYGDNCTDQTEPQLAGPPYNCVSGSTTFDFNLFPSSLVLSWQPGNPSSNTVTACGGNLSYSMYLSSTDLGTFTDPQFWINTLPPGINFVNATFTYPCTNTTYTITPDFNNISGIGWNLTPDFSSYSPNLNNGLPGTFVIGSNNQICITVNLQTMCGYTGVPISFYANGISPCSQTITTPSLSNIPTIDNSCCNSCNMTASFTAQTNVSCYGGSDGSATVTEIGGTAPFTYSAPWSGNLSSSTANGLSAGTYTVTVTDANMCSTTVAVTITQPTQIMPNATVVANVNCYGGNTGSATANPTGGNGPYNYSWNTNPPQTNQTATGLSAGTYTVTVTDANMCSATASVIISQPDLPLGVSITNVINEQCNGYTNGSATANEVGGVFPYTYNWSPSGGTNATASGLSAGTYTVTVMDYAGCTVTVSVTITQPPPLNVTITAPNIPCNALTTTATANVAGGTPMYSYYWSTIPQQTNQTATGLTAGTYSVEVVDADKCFVWVTVTITQATAPTVTTSVVNAGCNTAGSATANVLLGTAPYSYTWSPSGGTNANATGLTAGTYTVTVTDAYGCIGTALATISQPAAIIAPPPVTICLGSCTTLSGGIAQLGATYSWSPVVGLSSPNAITTMACPTVTTTYTLTATQGSCVHTVTVKVTVVPAPFIFINPNPLVLCNGSGVANLGVTVFSAATYSWSPVGALPSFGNYPHIGSYSTAITFTAPGTYTVTVNEDGGCTRTASITVTADNLAASITQSTPSCGTTSDGAATVTAIGGVTPYAYAWSNGETTSTATGLSAGTYSVTVTDHNGCSITASVVILHYATTPLVHLTVNHPTCIGGNTGQITATVSGGFGPYSYLWSPTGGTGATAFGLSGGSYYVTVTDAHGCIGSAGISIATTQALTITTTSLCTCPGAHNGAATALVSGGTLPYIYMWTPSGETNATATGLSNTTYIVTVTDANGCNNTATATVDVCRSLILGVDATPACYNVSNGSAIATVGGGTPPYSYVWAPSGGTNNLATGLSATMYTVTVIDFRNCTVTANTNVTNITNILTAEPPKPATVVCGLPNMYAVDKLTTLPYPVTYNWVATNTIGASSGTGDKAHITFNSPGGMINWTATIAIGPGDSCYATATESIVCGTTHRPNRKNDGDTNEFKQTMVYPNPANSILNIETQLSLGEVENICIYNPLGQQIRCVELRDDVTTMSISNLPSGLYFYRITDNSGTLIKSDKVMIVH